MRMSSQAHVNTWSIVGGTDWGGVGDMALMLWKQVIGGEL